MRGFKRKLLCIIPIIYRTYVTHYSNLGVQRQRQGELWLASRFFNTPVAFKSPPNIWSATVHYPFPGFRIKRKDCNVGNTFCYRLQLLQDVWLKKFHFLIHSIRKPSRNFKCFSFIKSHFATKLHQHHKPTQTIIKCSIVLSMQNHFQFPRPLLRLTHRLNRLEIIRSRCWCERDKNTRIIYAIRSN